MKLTAQVLSVVLLALFLQACQLGEDDDGEEEIDTITISSEYYEDDVTNENAYELILQATANYADFVAKDNLTEIKIYSDESYIEIDSDEEIGEIKIFGDGNTIVVKNGVNLTVTKVTITGDNNGITVFGVTDCSDTGVDNDVYANSVAVCT